MLRSSFCLLSSCLLLACSPEKSADTTSIPAAEPATPPAAAEATAATPAPTSGPAVSWPAPFMPAANRQCVRTATRSAIIYHIPVAVTSQFGQLTVGEKVTLAARTADGWVGFDPGTAQAANVGVFRLRWVREAEAFGGDSAGCAQLPTVQAPPAGCLVMAAHPIPVRAQPATGAALLSTIPTGSYAQVHSPADAATKGWTKIDLPGRSASGYVAEADINLTGPCR